MDYLLTEEQQELKKLVRRFAEEKVRPRWRELDEKAEFPRDLIEELARLDMFRIFVPEEYDG
ncbi:MAG: acyl-CoA dehydrogenase, partial [Candidatus Hydrothermota bacterium]